MPRDSVKATSLNDIQNLIQKVYKDPIESQKVHKIDLEGQI